MNERNYLAEDRELVRAKRNQRLLNERQERALDRIAKANPGATVNGWAEPFHGPIVHYTDGTRVCVAPTGYIRKMG